MEISWTEARREELQGKCLSIFDTTSQSEDPQNDDPPLYPYPITYPQPHIPVHTSPIRHKTHHPNLISTKHSQSPLPLHTLPWKYPSKSSYMRARTKQGMIAHSPHYLSQWGPSSRTMDTMYKKNVPTERHLSHDLLGTNNKVQKPTKKMIQESHLMYASMQPEI
ncbi:MAG: hypothetical protein Q9215_006272 [Flavoplaca cf. flavocitrina]